MMSQPDLSKIINSSDVQKVLRPVRGGAVSKRGVVQKKNPLKNFQVQLRLNPYAATFSKEKLGQKKLEASKPEPAADTFLDLLHEN
jgi:large subunit ribosomal protein L4e